MEKTTKLDNFVAIRDFLTEQGRDDWADVMTHEIELLDHRAAKARERAAAKREEADELTARIFETLNADNFMVINDIMNALIADYPEITPRKIATRLARLHANNNIVKEYVTVPDAEGKNRKILGYKVVTE